MNLSSAARRRVLRVLVAAAVLATVTPATATAASPDTVTLTIRHLDRAGRPTAAYKTTVAGLSGAGADAHVQPYDADGTATVRLPRGRYVLDSALTADADGGDDWIVQPRLDLDRDTTVTVDARTARPVDVRPPDGSARFLHSGMFLTVSHRGAERFLNRINSRPNLRVAHLGPAAEPGSVKQWFDAYWSSPSGVDYALGHTVTGRRALTGLTKHPAAQDLATLRIRAARPGSLALQPSAGPTVGVSRALTPTAPATYLVTPDRGTYDVSYTTDGSRCNADGVAVRAGRTTTLTFPSL
ncbi:hypothetical protein [Streptomyces sp. TRM49041]|uniref:hypothetical protein n=1 Tax=Streptomyces sp. TRM49041 TaxID=2603216 RepID=UPI0011EE4DE7|nr:hypothetical protein [Streptomyces sp. TRM49041]